MSLDISLKSGVVADIEFDNLQTDTMLLIREFLPFLYDFALIDNCGFMLDFCLGIH
jgi:hypothetical protein